VPVVCRRYDGLVHGVYRMQGKVKRSWELIDDSAAALRLAFATE